jgi:hypothetical protein
MNFGNQKSGGTSGPQALTISNTTATPLVIGQVGVTGPFTLPGLPALPANLGAGASLSIQVAFAPTAKGPCTGKVTIHESGGTIQDVPLTGMGT